MKVGLCLLVKACLMPANVLYGLVCFHPLLQTKDNNSNTPRKHTK